MTRKAFLLTIITLTASAVFGAMTWIENVTVSEHEFSLFARIVLDRLASIEEAIRSLSQLPR